MRYLFFSLFFILLFSLIIVYIRISNISFKENRVVKQSKEVEKERIDVIKVLADSKVKVVFPAKELYLKMDLNYVPKTTILYQTIINNLDKYKVFGIEQILELNKIRYSIIKSKNDLKLFINFDKKNQAIRIKRLFKNYNFNVQLKEVKIKG
jgi:hypothetical protein